MTDLLQVVPDFSTRPFTHLLPSLDKARITTNDLLTLDAAQVAKRAQLPAAELRKLVDALVPALHRNLGFGLRGDCHDDDDDDDDDDDSFAAALAQPAAAWTPISTLDDTLDAALGGGVPPGYLVEVTGESGAGKTQLLLTLLLAVQLASPRGLSKTAVYISTEAVLSTPRLAQLLSSHPQLTDLPPADRPSLTNVLAIQTPDLETQDHILRYQLPVAIQKHNVGLVILDSVAANYRAEFEKKAGAASMAKRSTQLLQLGALLREIARTHGVAIVVANQVADRFTRAPAATTSNPVSRTPSSASQGTRETTPQPSPFTDAVLLSPDPLALDHQQRWFTGWGSGADPAYALKTPSLGLVWTNQLACRIALVKEAVFAGQEGVSKWRRWARVVFAPWVVETVGRGVEFEITGGGVRSLVGGENTTGNNNPT